MGKGETLYSRVRIPHFGCAFSTSGKNKAFVLIPVD